MGERRSQKLSHSGNWSKHSRDSAFEDDEYVSMMTSTTMTSSPTITLTRPSTSDGQCELHCPTRCNCYTKDADEEDAFYDPERNIFPTCYLSYKL